MAVSDGQQTSVPSSQQETSTIQPKTRIARYRSQDAICPAIRGDHQYSENPPPVMPPLMDNELDLRTRRGKIAMIIIVSRFVAVILFCLYAIFHNAEDN